MGSLRNLTDHPEEDNCSNLLMKKPVSVEHEVWNVDSGSPADTKNDNGSDDCSALLNNSIKENKLSEASEDLGAEVQPQIAIQVTQEVCEPKAEQDQLKSVALQEVSLKVDVISSPESVNDEHQTELWNEDKSFVNQGEVPTTKKPCPEVRQNDNQEISQEITILVTSHDSSLEIEEEEEEEEEEQEQEEAEEAKGKSSELSSKPETITTSGPEKLVEDGKAVPEDGSIIVASLIKISEVEKNNIITSISEQSSNTGYDLSQNKSREDCTERAGVDKNGVHLEKVSPDAKQTTDVNTPCQSSLNETVCSVSSGETSQAGTEPPQETDRDPFEEKEPNDAQKMKSETCPMSSDSETKEVLSERLCQSPGKQQHVQTQYSLEVVSQSVATSPMTPPTGSAAFLFPSSFGKFGNVSAEKTQVETKDAEMQMKTKTRLKSSSSTEQRETKEVSSERLCQSPGKQQHVQTQYSLEVVSQSVATSPMTPPTGSAAFLFPSSFGKFGSVSAEKNQVETKDAEMQMKTKTRLKSSSSTEQRETKEVSSERLCQSPGKQQNVQTQYSLEVVSQSVATSPMTPPTGSAAFLFPSSFGKFGNVSAEKTQVETKDAEMQMKTKTRLKSSSSTEQRETKEVSSERLCQSPGKQQHVQTQYSLEVVSQSVATSPMTPPTGSAAFLFPSSFGKFGRVSTEKNQVETKDAEMQMKTKTRLKSSSSTEQRETKEVSSERICQSPGKQQNVQTQYSLEVVSQSVATSPMTPPTGSAAFLFPSSFGKFGRVSTEKNQVETKDAEMQMKTKTRLKSSSSTEQRETKEVSSERLCQSPGKQQHVQTQYSLEVVSQSVATSPMTPPTGSAAFLFPSSFGKFGSISTEKMELEKKDAEMQVALQVESRSVATAPMSPIVPTAPEVLPEPQAEGGSEDPVEPVQEVRWDEKGMTWEVYGAVVEVAVLGTAIQKHLEKQVKKHRKQPSTVATPTPNPTDGPSPPPSSPPPTSVSSHSGSTKGSSKKKDEKKTKRARRRQNPLRLMFRNMHQPSCCSRTQPDQ
ncbi:G protein-regulated inducer of neurite outgrowth 1 [Chanos chanos]|uniref:G protein-regulated inducer of neurite outgrowth 1 n=1 Tax=Chanos chanos TaxID=29144 RepID=A0A6J2UN61_CHACN|nr:G protein-regulated inducer of neurite outgrowth 1 [Chanos chanos]